MYQFKTGPVNREHRANSTATSGVTLLSAVDATGTCAGGSYSYRELQYHSVVVQAQLTITHRNGKATVDRTRGEVRFPTGYRCALHRGQCVDPEDGHTFWARNPVVSECYGSQLDVLFEGLVEFLIPDHNAERPSALTVVVVQEQSMSFYVISETLRGLLTARICCRSC